MLLYKQNEDDDMHYANWVSDYLKGSGDIRHGINFCTNNSSKCIK